MTTVFECIRCKRGVSGLNIFDLCINCTEQIMASMSLPKAIRQMELDIAGGDMKEANDNVV